MSQFKGLWFTHYRTMHYWQTLWKLLFYSSIWNIDLDCFKTKGFEQLENLFFTNNLKWHNPYLCCWQLKNVCFSKIYLANIFCQANSKDFEDSGWFCRYAKVDELVARQLWEEAHRDSNLFHGYGNRLKKLHFVSGLVLPIWPQIEQCLGSQIRHADRRLNVMRLETTGTNSKTTFTFIHCKYWKDITCWADTIPSYWLNDWCLNPVSNFL